MDYYDKLKYTLEFIYMSHVHVYLLYLLFLQDW